MLAAIGAQAAMAVFERQGAALQARFAARRDNAAEVAAFRANAPKLADVEALLKDRRALTMVLEAFQLEGEIDKRAMLRRVMTEDPAASDSLVNRLPDPRWKELANAFAAQRTAALTPEQIAQQSPEQLRALELNSIRGLTGLHVQALSAAQLAALDPAQVAAIRPGAIGAMDLGDVTALGAEQVAALTPDQIRGLSALQVAAIEPGDLAGLGADRIRALSATQIGALTSDQLRALNPDQIAAFTADQAAAFSTAQLDVLGATARATLAAAPAASPVEDAPAAAPRPLDDRALLDRIVAGAMLNRFEKAMGEANPGMREALYFRRMAGSATTIPGVMADRAMLEVVRGGLGLPRQFGLLNYEQQRDTIARRLDVEDLQDPKAVARLTARYLSQVEAAPPANPYAALLDNSGNANTIATLAIRGLSIRA